MEIVDSHILLEEPTEDENHAQNEKVRQAKIRECLISLARIGIACSIESPGERMNIKDVIIGLTAIKDIFLGAGIHGRRQPRMRIAGEGTLSNETDRLALLSFKELIAEDPHGSLSSWNNSLYLCEWDAVTCSRKHQRVVILDLRGKSLSGIISPFLGNLSFLRHLYLQNNRFQGKIPLELGRLFRLEYLNISRNSLLEGEIPADLPTSLSVVDLSHNDLVGKIPASFGSLSNLTSLDLYSNNLVGGIPPYLGNLSLLRFVDLGKNSLTGTIPHSLPNLWAFAISGNKLSGTVPPSLYNISTLEQLFIAGNPLTGSLPQDIGLTLPNLHSLSVGYNQLWGPFPISLSNASKMQDLDLSQGNLSGPVPFDLGRKMNDLVLLNLGDNNLASGDASNLRFIDSLTNCSKLQILGFNRNGFGGVLPASIANLSNHLYGFLAGGNQLVGSIPAGISNFVHLAVFGLDQNFFSGAIPFEIGKLRNLELVSFGKTKLSGPIPASIGNLSRIFELYLNDNNLNGTVPSSIENILGLQTLVLSHNFLTCPIPKTLGLFSTLTFLDFANNSFMGDLPTEIGKLNNLQELDVSDNKLSGHIPSSLGNCLKLEGLFLEGNTFQRSIPPSFSSLKGLEILDLSRNNLSGQIQEDLVALVFLKNLNLSFNYLTGEVPLQGVFGNLSIVSLVGKKGLCGGITELQLAACPNSMKKRNRFGVKIIVSITCTVVVGTLILLNSDDGQTNSLAIKGSIGYVALEYGIGGNTSTEGDVYSYGILLLEMLTGKRPTNELFTNGQSLHEFSMLALPERVMEIVDSRMPLEEPGKAEMDAQNDRVRQDKIRSCLISLVRIGVACSAQSPSKRMNFKDVIVGLMTIRKYLLEWVSMAGGN
ncbi:hypothetical protein RHSIM_Rhsim09G0176100 [Rhododendron simsii]|uniref:non-specific serine/threonine protein kinase n=1 Tax=Rhododendron simsii TaxID=118357 RepID=A0A834GL49_RHOSS|nr:hypothetical protein RHSIM_Rhsim09G0176100 [Rhododendron simsii]